MSSFHESFASESEFVTVGPKKSNGGKSGFQQTKPMSENTSEVKPPTLPIVSTMSEVQSDEKTDEGSTSSKPRGPRKPPSGIFVNLGPDWKKFVRGLIPNKSSKTSDDMVMNEISKVKTNPNVTNFEFKKIVCMIFHQALKTDRNTLVDKIINCWTRSRYNIVELIDSTYDGCKPMTQACWSGSIYCIQRLTAADPSGSVLYTVHPTKNETILDTLQLGKNYAIEKDPATALFSADRFDKCERFIRTAMERHEASKLSELETVSTTISPEIKESIDSIVEAAEGSNTTIIDELTLKLIDLFLEDQSKSTEYFKAVKDSVDAEIFNQIDSRLKDEGIEIN